MPYRTPNFPIDDLDESEVVICDLCGKDWTDVDETGGFLLLTTAVCPDCHDKTLADVKFHREEGYIREVCPDTRTFADFIRWCRKRY